MKKIKKVLKKRHWSEDLRDVQACAPAIKWCRKKSSLLEAWKTCRNGGWMLWLIDLLNDKKFYKIDSDWYFEYNKRKKVSRKKVRYYGNQLADYIRKYQPNPPNGLVKASRRIKKTSI